MSTGKYGFEASYWYNSKWQNVHVFLDPEAHSLLNIYDRDKLTVVKRLDIYEIIRLEQKSFITVKSDENVSILTKEMNITGVFELVVCAVFLGCVMCNLFSMCYVQLFLACVT